MSKAGHILQVKYILCDVTGFTQKWHSVNLLCPSERLLYSVSNGYGHSAVPDSEFPVINQQTPVRTPGASSAQIRETSPNPISPGDSGGRAGSLTKPYKN